MKKAILFNSSLLKHKQGYVFTPSCSLRVFINETPDNSLYKAILSLQLLLQWSGRITFSLKKKSFYYWTEAKSMKL